MSRRVLRFLEAESTRDWARNEEAWAEKDERELIEVATRKASESDARANSGDQRINELSKTHKLDTQALARARRSESDLVARAWAELEMGITAPHAETAPAPKDPPDPMELPPSADVKALSCREGTIELYNETPLTGAVARELASECRERGSLFFLDDLPFSRVAIPVDFDKWYRQGMGCTCLPVQVHLTSLAQ